MPSQGSHETKKPEAGSTGSSVLDKILATCETVTAEDFAPLPLSDPEQAAATASIESANETTLTLEPIPVPQTTARHRLIEDIGNIAAEQGGEVQPPMWPVEGRRSGELL
ncbi:MAG TPA: hypothetical protein VJR27_00690 [Candidatus Saccharimonadales bacterium]|nr:hypothetical protein [Candidatus Saccharimonadales bacterium]